MRHIVRDPRLERLTGGGASSAVGDVSVSQQPEIILIPLIPDYFPSSVSPLFQQLMQLRREATVSYSYRDRAHRRARPRRLRQGAVQLVHEPQ